MREWWNRALEHYVTMQKREQLLVLFVLLFLLFMVWYTFVWANISAWQQRSQATAKTLQREVDVFQSELAVLQAKLRKDPNQFVNAKEAQLKQNMAALNETMQLYSTQLLSSSDLMLALQDVLAEEKGVTLEGIDILPEQEEKAADDHGSLKLYQHGVKLVFLADYFTTMAYLQKLEALKWRLFWDHLDYRVTTYPMAEVTLTLHTLSGSHDA
jgi:MSHA biogenesis protein MshJ